MKTSDLSAVMTTYSAVRLNQVELRKLVVGLGIFPASSPLTPFNHEITVTPVRSRSQIHSRKLLSGTFDLLMTLAAGADV